MTNFIYYMGNIFFFECFLKSVAKFDAFFFFLQLCANYILQYYLGKFPGGYFVSGGKYSKMKF